MKLIKTKELQICLKDYLGTKIIKISHFMILCVRYCFTSPQNLCVYTSKSFLPSDGPRQIKLRLTAAFHSHVNKYTQTAGVGVIFLFVISTCSRAYQTLYMYFKHITYHLHIRTVHCISKATFRHNFEKNRACAARLRKKK